MDSDRGGRKAAGSAGEVEIAAIDPAHPYAQYCLDSYFAELNARFDDGFAASQSIPAPESDLRPPAGLLLVASLHAKPVGCGALRFHGDVCEIKRMWVSGNARGLGLGRRLLSELESHAVTAGTRILHLETNKNLAEAISLYRSAGFSEVPAFNDETYAHHWFEKQL
jgi:ribosomal protein S18 acetylase RimI-like enzyme